MATFFISCMAGGAHIGLGTAIKYLLNPRAGGIGKDIMWRIRVPRVILGFLVGAGLAACGTVFQGLLRNPLAEPYTLGVSGGAALGVAIGVSLHITSVYLPLVAFTGSVTSIFLVYAIASRKRFSNNTLILGGVILNFMFSALVFLVFALSRSEDVYTTVLWLMGDLSSPDMMIVKVLPFVIPPAIIFLFLFSRELNILTLGEEKARHLGVDPEVAKRALFLVASGITGFCVAASGIVGFVGLIVPHFARYLVGANMRVMLPAACVIGAIFLVLCDALARVIIKPLELPVGIITGVCGGVFFLSFLLRSKRWEIF